MSQNTREVLNGFQTTEGDMPIVVDNQASEMESEGDQQLATNGHGTDVDGMESEDREYEQLDKELDEINDYLDKMEDWSDSLRQRVLDFLEETKSRNSEGSSTQPMDSN